MPKSPTDTLETILYYGVNLNHVSREDLIKLMRAASSRDDHDMADALLATIRWTIQATLDCPEE